MSPVELAVARTLAGFGFSLGLTGIALCVVLVWREWRAARLQSDFNQQPKSKLP